MYSYVKTVTVFDTNFEVRPFPDTLVRPRMIFSNHSLILSNVVMTTRVQTEQLWPGAVRCGGNR